MITTPFNTLDSVFLNLDSREEPWSVQLEVRVQGKIDGLKLLESIRLATLVHPMARARLQPFKEYDTSYVWEILDKPEFIPFAIVNVESEESLSSIRSRLQSYQVPLISAPPFAVVLAHHPDGDYIMLNVSHVVGDGLSAFRLMTSIARKYAGLLDPVPEFDPLSHRNLAALAGSKNIAERIKRAGLLLEHLWNSRVKSVRIKTKNVFDHNADLTGYGLQTLYFTSTETASIMEKREKPATINDLLLAALAIAIRQWNIQEQGDVGRISIMMPVNLRPKDWWFEVVSNFSSYIPVSLDVEQQNSLKEATLAVASLTGRLKEDGGASTLIDLLEGVDNLKIPAVIKRHLRTVAPKMERTSIDTAVLSNLGRLDEVLDFADAGKVKELWFSPPGLMPLGVSIGAAYMDSQLFITMRYRKAQFDVKAAMEFAALYRQILLDSDS
ncbi:hypothetical protein [Acinetobacter junii]|uniref:hypothetical protein n=1 Tax=Acinetobacter junii TaxID=40215 RepID=UPI0032142A3C